MWALIIIIWRWVESAGEDCIIKRTQVLYAMKLRSETEMAGNQECFQLPNATAIIRKIWISQMSSMLFQSPQQTIILNNQKETIKCLKILPMFEGLCFKSNRTKPRMNWVWCLGLTHLIINFPNFQLRVMIVIKSNPPWPIFRLGM